MNLEQQYSLFSFRNLLSLTGNAIMDTSPQSAQNLLISEHLLFSDTFKIEILFFCVPDILLAIPLAL